MPTDLRPQRPFPKVLAAAAGVALAARLFGPSVQDRMKWVALAASEDAARASRRPILYNFTADWCGPCKRLERDVFADARSARWLGEQFVPVRVLDREREEGRNPDDVEQLQLRFGVQAFPTLVVVGADGAVLARLEGYAGGPREVSRQLGEAAHKAALPAPRGR
jgi:thiol:disulfide interchange protein